jgi:hypothetical protein
MGSKGRIDAVVRIKGSLLKSKRVNWLAGNLLNQFRQPGTSVLKTVLIPRKCRINARVSCRKEKFFTLSGSPDIAADDFCFLQKTATDHRQKVKNYFLSGSS